MTTAIFQFPGDPAVPVRLMTVGEFLATTPSPREVVISTATGETRIDLGAEVTCDICNAFISPDAAGVVHPDAPVALAINDVYCVRCRDEHITPYLIAAPTVSARPSVQ